MRKNPAPPAGVVHRLRHVSECLAGNRWGDPVERDVLVYTPPGYDPSRRYPLWMDLVGYMGSGASHTNWRPFGLNLPERLDRLLAAGAIQPAVVVMPDGFTSLGGNQYVDSTGVGAYMSWLCDEVVPFVEAHFAVARDRRRRAVFGKSSGGYGALVHGMLRPDVWGALASHSGDAYFEYAYLTDFPRLLRELLNVDGDPARLLEAVASKEKLGSDLSHALMSLGMAATYDPDPDAPLGFQLPVDALTGRVREDRWTNWLRWDPVRMVPDHLEALRSLRGVYVDCGRRDQYHLLWGARMVHAALDAGGVAHRYEEFDDDHSDVDYRMDQSLPFLSSATSEPT